MVCRFLKDFSFKKLIAPVSPDEFFELYWEKQPLVVQRNDASYYQDLFCLKDFDREVAYAPKKLKTVNAHGEGGGKAYASSSHSETFENLLVDLGEGSTVVLDEMQHRMPNLGLLCRLLGSELGFRFQTNIYLTPPDGKGFSPHHDSHDVFVLQLMGAKEWRINRKQTAMPRLQDVVDVSKIRMGRRPRKIKIQAGDLVYLPRGFVHDATSEREASMHITLGVYSTSWEDLLNAMTRLASEENWSLRKNLPPGFVQQCPEPIAEQLRSILTECCKGDFLERVVSQLSDETITQFPMDFSGQVEAHFSGAELSPEDKVGPRRALIYKMRPENGEIKMLFGGRQVTFPSFLDAPLRYCLSTKAFKVKSIPGDLADSERVAVVERLMQEGLLVRK